MNVKVILLCLVACFTLASCDDKPATTCIGTGNIGVPTESMSDVDKFFINTDFNSYVGSSVGKLEQDFVIRFSERAVVTKHPAKVQWIDYKFRSNYSLRVYLSEVKYITYNDKTDKWNFSKLGKETISGINVTHSGAGDFYYCKDFGAAHL